MNIRKNYNCTLAASYIGYISQAIVNLFAPLLFLTFQRIYHIPIEKITLLVTVNFGVQLCTDLLSARLVDSIGYRTAAVAAHLAAAAGLFGLAFFPEWFADPYAGLLAAAGLYAVGGGLIEVMISPIVEACPTDRKAAAMSLLHSFYCWGGVLVILLSTLFFAAFGVGHWRVLACLWAAVPLANALFFSQVPIAALVEAGEGLSLRELFSMRMIWLFVLLMVCAGAAENAVSQWASAFTESALGVSKVIGDLAGPCFFMTLMGLARVLYAKWSDRLPLMPSICISSLGCAASYFLIVFAQGALAPLIGCGLCGLFSGVLWPGTFSLASAACPRGGIAMFALLALAGDIGCAVGPTLVGFVSGAAGGDMKAGILAASACPVLLAAGILRTRQKARRCR